MPDNQVITCMICGHTDHRFMNKPRPELTMMKCHNCGLIFVVPLWKKDIAQDIFTNFDGWPQGIVGGAGNRGESMKYVAQIITDHKFKIGRLLDIGCANGLFFDILRQTNTSFKLYGVDLDSRWSELDYGDAEVFIGTLQQANFPDQSFDVITFQDALYYIPDVLEELQEIARILKPGGLFVFDLPNQIYLQLRGFFGRLLRMKRTQTFVAYPTYFSDHSLQILLNNVGINITSMVLNRGAIQSESYLHAMMSFYIFLIRRLSTLYPHIRKLAPRTIYVGCRSTISAQDAQR